MDAPLLDTKFSAPRPRSGLVSRPTLVSRLARGAEKKLTLISAPAGFGKTSLLAGWLAAAPVGGRSVAWLSLDKADNEPVSFWTYLMTALRTAAPDVGAGAQAELQAAQPPPIESTLSLLINDLAAVPSEIVVVLDDYHLVTSPVVQGGMAFLLDHLPPQVHLVMSTRADPALPLARLRGRGELSEIRAADLRFSPEEAATYLNEVMRLGLGTTEIAALNGRTEGWIAALQLAALSIQDREDAPAFIETFSGDDRYVVDYLVEEVLDRQPDDIRTFLLETSVLDRLSGPLCDAVTGRRDGGTMLEALDRRNLFLVPLDDRRHWYRYHQLFADVLRARLLGEQPDLALDLHRRASAWYERHGEPFEAIGHALEGEAFEQAAGLIEAALPALRQARQEVTMRRWLEALPDATFVSRPVLSVHRAGLLLANGDSDGAEARLRDAERWLAAAEGGGDGGEVSASAVVVRDPDDLRRLPAQIAIYRAARAQAAGDLGAARAHARRALDLVGDGDDFERGAAAGFLAIAQWREGDLEVSHGYWGDAMASLRSAGHIVDAIGCMRPMAQIRLAQGRLREAMSTYRRGLALASRAGPPTLRGAADMHVGMAEVFLEWGDLGAVEQQLVASRQLGEHAGLAQNPYRWRVVMARARQAHGDLEGALQLLQEAEDRYVSEYYPDVRPVRALKARIWVRQGRLAEAADWAHDRGLSVDDDLSYIREFEHITLARALIAQARQNGAESLAAALHLLERLLTAAEEGRRTGSVIEILILQALARQQVGDVPAALAPLERALSLAEPERSVRVFMDEGAALAALIAGAGKRGVTSGQVADLLTRLRGAAATPPGQDLVEPLSERELDVMRLLATELDGPGIAGELVVGLSTVRSHTKSIYAKLGVHSRRAAVRRAQELGIVPRANAT